MSLGMGLSENPPRIIPTKYGMYDRDLGMLCRDAVVDLRAMRVLRSVAERRGIVQGPPCGEYAEAFAALGPEVPQDVDDWNGLNPDVFVAEGV
jgi:hypothetical protein